MDEQRYLDIFARKENDAEYVRDHCFKRHWVWILYFLIADRLISEYWEDSTNYILYLESIYVRVGFKFNYSSSNISLPEINFLERK